MFDKQEINKREKNLIMENSHKSNVDHISNTNKIPCVPARVSHTSVPVTDTDRHPRAIQNSLVSVTNTDGRPWVNPKTIAHMPKKEELKM